MKFRKEQCGMENTIKKPKVSVIVPVYNVEKYIKQALDSLVNQSLYDIEFICINDCTPDKSFEIVREYAAKDNRFVLIEQKTNQGQGIARNVGLEIAKGDYIMFLDSDDWFELDACEQAYNLIKRNQNDMVLFSYYNYYENSHKKELRTNMIKPFSKVINDPQIVLKDIDTAFFRSALTVMYIYRKDFLNNHNIRYGNERLGEDIDFCFKALVNCANLSILNAPLYNYRQRNNSASQNYDLWKDLINVRYKIYENMLNCDINQSWFVKYYIVYMINSLFSWFEIFSRKNPKISKVFYSQLRDFFIRLEKSYDITSIKRLLGDKNFTYFNLCIENKSLLLYKVKRFLFKLYKESKKHVHHK